MRLTQAQATRLYASPAISSPDEIISCPWHCSTLIVPIHVLQDCLKPAHGYVFAGDVEKILRAKTPQPIEDVLKTLSAARQTYVLTGFMAGAPEDRTSREGHVYVLTDEDTTRVFATMEAALTVMEEQGRVARNAWCKMVGIPEDLPIGDPRLTHGEGHIDYPRNTFSMWSPSRLFAVELEK